MKANRERLVKAALVVMAPLLLLLLLLLLSSLSLLLLVWLRSMACARSCSACASGCLLR